MRYAQGGTSPQPPASTPWARAGVPGVARKSAMAVTEAFRGKRTFSSPIALHEGIFSLVPRLPLLDDNGPLHPQLSVEDAEVAERARRVEGEGPGAAADAKGTQVGGVEVPGGVEHRTRLG